MHRTIGIILKREDFRERDERVVLYTKNFGKISVITKGVKRIEAKLRGNLDIFNFVDIIFVEGSHFFILIGIDLKERFYSIEKNPSIYSAALSIVRIVDGIFEENLPDEDFFEFILHTIRRIDEYGGKAQDGVDLYSWLLFKKFQLAVVKNQGYGMDTEKISDNARALLAILDGKKRESVRLARRDLLSLEDLFVKKFLYLFSVRAPSWLPKT